MSPPDTLSGWLDYIEALHPKTIAMGLERVSQVRRQLDLNPGFVIVTIGGTNGKGSTCAMLERIYHAAGYSVGCYTSPHLLRYNERVRVNLQEAPDKSLCDAFKAVEKARRDSGTELTYFEFGTLAAVWYFMQKKVDMAILEVGLGGRLDAVNVFDTDCAIVTTVDLDHMDFLGDSRESIGYEKAGIFRTGKPAICGDQLPPDTLAKYAAEVRADFRQVTRDFFFDVGDSGWHYRGKHFDIANLPKPALIGEFQLGNAACALTAVEALQNRLPVHPEHIVSALLNVALAGRFQQVSERPQIILDVAHNPQAALSLAGNLRKSPCKGKTLAVFGMLADKDIAQVIQIVRDQVDAWYLAGIFHPRGASADQLADCLRQLAPHAVFCVFFDVKQAFHQACLDASENDRIITFGSFFTVADVMQIVNRPN